MVSIEEFCEFHGACQDVMEWARSECHSMDDVWQKAEPEWLVWVATRPGVATPKEQRLLAVYASRSVSRLLTAPSSHHAIEVAERHAHGLAADGELAAAWDDARDAARDAAQAVVWAASAAAWAAAAAARDAAWAALATASASAWQAERAAASAARAAARAAEAAARDAAEAAASDAASADAWKDFARWVRTHVKPDFTRLSSIDE